MRLFSLTNEASRTHTHTAAPQQSENKRLGESNAPLDFIGEARQAAKASASPEFPLSLSQQHLLNPILFSLILQASLPPPLQNLDFDALLILHITVEPSIPLQPNRHTAMYGQDPWFSSLIKPDPSDHPFPIGGLFLDQTVSPSFVSLVSSKRNECSVSCSLSLRAFRRGNGGFLAVSLSMKEGSDEGYIGESGERLGQNGNKNLEEGESSEQSVSAEEKSKEKIKERGSGALNTTKHLWAGAVAAMVSRTFVAPLERLKLEYIVRGEQKNLFELIKTIAAIQGLKGFWKGNFVNILRTAPFKAINFYAYDTYRNELLKITGNKETTNFERFLAGATAGITATLLCLPMDTIRTKMVAPGGEALGGVIGTFRHMIQAEGFFSLYKGLLPSIVSMAPSGAVFYGVYDILKMAYLHSPEGRKRIENMKQGQDLNALDQMELGAVRTLLYGAIAGACAEAATYPFEVVRRHLQMQVRATKLSTLATCVKIVEQGGIPALYAGLVPSLLQVLPSAAISYFVYEFMKIVLKVE